MFKQAIRIFGLSVLSTASLALLSKPVLATVYVSERANSNPNAEFRHRIQCSGGSFVTGMVVDEQGGYGVIDIKFLCSNGTETTWATQNQNTENRYIKYGKLRSLRAYEQHNYGLIDFKYWSEGGDQGIFTENARWDDYGTLDCSNNHVIGAEIYEQNGYGVVDIALVCQS